jgi:hypothetical protein
MAQFHHQEVLHEAVGVLDHEQLAPGGRLAEQFEQYPLGFGTCIRRLRSHLAHSLPPTIIDAKAE